MKPPRFDYHAPATLDEAVRLRTELGPEASILAGGQSLIPLLNLRFARPSALIDLRRVHELVYVRTEQDGVAVGAMTRQRQLERSADAARLFPLLQEAQRCVAHPVIRNRGTVGGTIAHADPAAELPAVLRVLGGHVTVRGPRGERRIDADELFQFHFTTSLEPDEILTEVFFPALRPDAGSAYLELSRRHGDYPLAGVAAIAAGDHVRLCFAALGPTPVLVESDDPADWDAAIEPAGDIHASAGYRRELAAVLGGRALALARERATGGAP